MSEPAAPPVESPKLLRSAYYAVWFVAVPAALAALTIWVLKPAVVDPYATGFDKLRFWVHDQPVPVGIVLFTVFEMALYHYRYSLPWAERVGLGGRADIDPEHRKTFEQASHLLEETARLRKKNAKAIERHVPSAAREKLDAAIGTLRKTMDAKEFDVEAFNEALERAAGLVDRHLGRWRKGELREYAESIGIAVAVALLLRAFVVEAFKIPSGSMLPTLQIQDHIFVNKFLYGPTIPFTKKRIWQHLPPHYGDVMVFEFPDPNPNNERQDFIKRVIALPGDTLQVEDGHPLINGWRVPSCQVGEYEFSEGDDAFKKRGQLFVEFLGEYSYLTLFEEDRASGAHEGPYKVKEGEVWVLGDNRNNSSDSRAWNNGRGGGAPFENIKGRAMFVWMSFENSGGITWDRLLTNVMGKPRLPKGADPALVTGIEKCLQQRPSLAETTPPAPQ
ncbi:MAG: signal peptidase I [Polyangiaceae bacterium]